MRADGLPLVAWFLAAALALTSCGGVSVAPSPVLPPAPVLTGSIASVDSFSGSSLPGAGPVEPLFAIPNIPTNDGTLGLIFWGTKDAAGNILNVVEGAVSFAGNPPNFVYMFFDATQHPVFFRDAASGYGIAVSYDSPTQTTATLCDPQGNPQGFSVANSGGVTVADGGSCAVQLITMSRVHAQQLSAGCPPPPSTNVCNLGNLAQLITAASYVGGLGFAIGAIAKFKAHKDNPTQVPISQGIALIFIAAALIFIPSIFKTSGGTLFNDETAPGTIEGVTSFPTFQPVPTL